MSPGRTHKVGAGNVGTGEFAHEWALQLRDDLIRQGVRLPIDAQGRAVDALTGKRKKLAPHSLALLSRLGIGLEAAE